jgi:hypothetical protein
MDGQSGRPGRPAVRGADGIVAVCAVPALAADTALDTRPACGGHAAGDQNPAGRCRPRSPDRQAAALPLVDSAMVAAIAALRSHCRADTADTRCLAVSGQGHDAGHRSVALGGPALPIGLDPGHESGHPDWTAARTPAAKVSNRARVGGCCRKVSPGRRPLVGCSQRQYAWCTRRASRARSCHARSSSRAARVRAPPRTTRRRTRVPGPPRFASCYPTP